MTRASTNVRKDMTSLMQEAKEKLPAPVQKPPFTLSFVTRPVSVGELVYSILAPHNLKAVSCDTVLDGPPISFVTLCLKIEFPDGSVYTHNIRVDKETTALNSLLGFELPKRSKLQISVIEAGGPPEALWVTVNFEVI